MEREKLERSFCWKISGELKLFKYHVLQKDKEDVYALAYRIDCIISIYEILMEFSKKMTMAELEQCMQIPEILTHLYWRWLKMPDSRNEELERTVRTVIREIKTEAA